MKIITWNCNMAYRRKAGYILAHQPDIVVLQECECPENLKFGKSIPHPTDILWYGTNKHKGVAVISYSNYRFRLLNNHNTDLKIIVPISVTGGAVDFTLLAIWANNPNDPDGQYVEQVWKALKHYDKLLKRKNIILTGDFNSNTIWDKKYREGNHSTVVKHLAGRGIHSAYHLHHNQVQGREQHPTFYLYRHQNKPYHMDYCFASKNIIKKMQTVEVGDHAYWTQYSDHVPIIVTIDDEDNLSNL